MAPSDLHVLFQSNFEVHKSIAHCGAGCLATRNTQAGSECGVTILGSQGLAPVSSSSCRSSPRSYSHVDPWFHQKESYAKLEGRVRD